MSNVIVTVDAPPRGTGQQAAKTFQAQALKCSLAWGGSPSTATLVYPGGTIGTGVTAGCWVQLQIGGMTFYGIGKSDVEVTSSRGHTRELQFADLREFLTWDFVKGSFNNPVRRLDNGVWKKRWWHIYPADFDTYTKTWTDAPLPAWKILALLLTAPTVGSPWSWDLTSNGQWPGGLMNQPVFSFDCLQGVRLDAALNDLSERGGLVFCLDPRPFDHYRLVWTRKGYGIVPLSNIGFPSNSDERRSGLALSGNATNINVLGERNRYTVLNLPLKPDWNGAWEQFLVGDALYLDIYNNEKDPVSGVAYNSFPNDPENWKGAMAAKIRSLEITVGQYVALRNARAADGDQFADGKKFSGRSRMDMPAALYISSLVFRAYKPNPAAGGITNLNGAVIPLDSVAIADAMLCRVDYDPVSGTMTPDLTQLVDGNGIAIVKGAAFGHDLFQLVQPERITGTFFSANNRPWSVMNFQIDDTGEGQRYLIFDAPVFTSENMLTTVNGYTVLNAHPTIQAAVAQAALTFELEPFSYWKGTWPNVSRDRVEFVSGLFAEYAGMPGNYREITYANGETAATQADRIASNLLLCQYIYAMGGYKLNWQPNVPIARFTIFLNSVIDRVDLEIGPAGTVAMVDFTTERERDHFVPERDLERRTLQNTLFPGQAELRATALDYKRFLAGIKGMSRELFNTFMEFLNGNFDDTMQLTRFDPDGVFEVPKGAQLAVGTPIFKPPVDPTTNPPTNTLATYPPNIDPAVDTVFVGVTVRDGEAAEARFM